MAKLSIKRLLSYSVLRHKASLKNQLRNLVTAPRVVEVGKCEKPKTDEGYKTGQTFLHLLFDYRGVILYPWLAKVHDMDLVTKNQEGAVKDEKSEVKAKEKIYYQVLIDDRDLEYSSKWLKAEQMVYVPEDGMITGLNSVSGLDYVSHEDILPYTGVDSSPIENKFLNQFLSYVNKHSPHYEAQENLFKHPWLKTYDVFRKTTENIRVTVIPAFMGIQSKEYWWRYCIRLENLGTETVQLRQREWRIYPRAGAPMRVRGRGVIGEEPILSPEYPFYQYSSQVSLQSTCGYMGGIYTMEGQDQRQFEVKIPNFSLQSKLNFDPANEV